VGKEDGREYRRKKGRRRLCCVSFPWRDIEIERDYTHRKRKEKKSAQRSAERKREKREVKKRAERECMHAMVLSFS
jgi:hypothetical protein